MKRRVQIRILLIRHGETAGNLEKRYIGRTDEELCSAGRQKLEQIREEGGGYFREQEKSCRLPDSVQAVLSSPMTLVVHPYYWMVSSLHSCSEVQPQVLSLVS